jgi:uncharacterized Zn finger protein
MGDFGFGWGNYVSVAEKRLRAEKKLAKLMTQGRPVAPVTIEGRKIAKNFWGKSWCSNLERYSDFASRLPRGRSYVCNGFVVDLQIAKGKVEAKVSGSELYDVVITIAPVAVKRWRAICRDCSGSIDSLVELLQGRLAKGVMDRVCREGDGLFPSPTEIKLSCSCPDWADMCKHVAAALYGVGARLDEKPQLLFVLRGVDENDLLANAGHDVGLAKARPGAKLLDDADVGALFGLEMAEVAVSDLPVTAAPKQPRQSRARKTVATPADKTPADKKTLTARKTKKARPTATKPEQKPSPQRRSGQRPTTSLRTGKRRAQLQPVRSV